MRKLAATGLLVFSLLLPLSAQAVFSVEDSGLNKTAGSAYGQQYVDERPSLGAFIGEFIIKPVLGLLGLLFLSLSIYAGVMWMTAMGNEKRVTKAKDIIIAAVIGMVIVISAYSMTSALMNAITKGDING